MDFKKLFRKDDKAVSPVIGVILMVAITVILAAAIGSSVFNQNPTQTASKASINVKAAGLSGTDKNVGNIKIEHLGGDTLDFAGGKAKITATKSGGNSVTIDTTGHITKFSAGDVVTLDLATITTGETMPTLASGDTVNIKITDTATNQVVCDRDVKF
jgi:flagellin-like protein